MPLKHPDPPTVRADPCWPVCNAPCIFLETIITYLKTAGAVPAKRQFFFACVTLEFFICPASPSAAPPGAAIFLFGCIVILIHKKTFVTVQRIYFNEGW